MQTDFTRMNILNCDPDELAGIVARLGEKNFRAKQLWKWLSGGTESFAEMTNLPAAFREKLEAEYEIGLPEAVRIQESSRDGTRKCLFRFRDGCSVESVFMRYHYGNSICISSQAGCRMGCTFCASTRKGLERNLTAGEMLGQVLSMRNLTGEPIGHVVVMGIGEPFDNFEELAKFLRMIHDPDGYGISWRSITVSTCGLLQRIPEFAEEFPQVNLAVSLHAPNDELRRRMMPVVKSCTVEELMEVCREYTGKTGRRITFEYALIDGVNDSEACAKELSKHLRGWLTHVNLIPLNPVKGTGYGTSGEETVQRFRKVLEQAGVPVTVRRTLGTEIDAACGQLRLG